MWRLLLFIYCLAFFTINVAAQEKPQVNIGGALRFNYNVSTWKKEQVKRGGDFGYDVFRLNTKAKYKGVQLNAEFRFYSPGFGGPMLKQGWFQYDFSEKNNLQIGLTQACFGNTPYNSHSWFFSMNYYVGLEDDHDMGIKYTHKDSKWQYAVAFFKNAEEYTFGNTADLTDGRYAYDYSSIDLDGDGDLELRNKEVNQVNARVERSFSKGESMHVIGVSGEFGGLYNLDTKKMGSHFALDIHYRMEMKKVGLKATFLNFKSSPINKDGERRNAVAMTAYGAPYLVSSLGNIYSAGVFYKIPVDGKLINSLQFYNDFSYFDKMTSGFEASLMNVAGVLTVAGPMYIYTDFAFGKNQPWLGSNWTTALAEGDKNANWEMRFNINMGYYF